MSELNTELLSALLKNESIDEVFRSHLEDAMNDFLKIELMQFLGYEKSSTLGYNTGNRRNGFYERDLDTAYGKLHFQGCGDQVETFHKRQLSDCLSGMLSSLWMLHTSILDVTAWPKSRSMCSWVLHRT